MPEKKHDKCEVCGEDLIYVSNLSEYKKISCYFCDKTFDTNIFCREGHYICDICHSKDPIKIVEEICEVTPIKDPFALADFIMEHPKFKMYGPEHHALTPAVIITTMRNNRITKLTGEEINLFDIKEAIKRGSKIPGGWCGYYGSCGAGIGAGVAISIFTGATPSRDLERSLANQMTSLTLAKIADNLEHCCKRSVKLAICETLEFLKRNFNIELDYKSEGCEFSSLNDKCEFSKCPIFKN